jgi:hypothetical protein
MYSERIRWPGRSKLASKKRDGELHPEAGFV